MPTPITISLTDDEVAIVAAHIAAKLATAPTAATTPAEWVRERITLELAQANHAVTAAAVQELAPKFALADDATKATIRTALGKIAAPAQAQEVTTL